MVFVRLDAPSRRKMIIDTGVEVARISGVMKLDHWNVAVACPIATSDSTVRHYFHTLTDLRDAIRAADQTLPEVVQ